VTPASVFYECVVYGILNSQYILFL